jgi:hypothetical protein
MTRFGKILVLFNVGLSVMLAAWSFNLYANSVDWTDSKSKGTPAGPSGQYAIRAAKLEELWKGVAPNQADWLRQRMRLAEEETRLAEERTWYDQELRHVLNGPTNTGKFVQEIAIADKDTEANVHGERILIRRGDILLDAQGHPQLVPIRDPMNAPLQLKSLAEYNAEYVTVMNDIAAQIKTHSDQIEEAKTLTDKIIGDKMKGIRGLQQRINDEQAKDAAIVAEMKLEEPQLLNTLVEAQLVNKRHQQMVKRIEELKKIKVAGTN